MIAVTVLLACMFAMTPSVAPKKGASSGSISAPQAQAPNGSKATSPKPGEFYDKVLDLHFNYPVEMKVLDANAEMEIGHRNIYGVSGANDPEHQAAKRCVLPLLEANLPADKAPPRAASLDGVWVDDSKEHKETRKSEPIFAQILIFEMVRDCLPKKLQKKENDALGTLAMSLVSEAGITRMQKPLWYKVGKQKIHMKSGVGRPIVNGKVIPTPIVIMSMATQWHGHLLAWVFISNDTEIFNEITKSVVQFGDGPRRPMFAEDIGPDGSGTPVTILPK